MSPGVDVGIDYGRKRVGLAICISGVVVPQQPLLEPTWDDIASRLRERGFEVHLQRETGTTLEARQFRDSSRRDGKTDSLAAAIVLKRFLGMA